MPLGDVEPRFAAIAALLRSVAIVREFHEIRGAELAEEEERDWSGPCRRFRVHGATQLLVGGDPAARARKIEPGDRIGVAPQAVSFGQVLLGTLQIVPGKPQQAAGEKRLCGPRIEADRLIEVAHGAVQG